MTPETAKAVSERARCLYSREDVEAALDNMAADITATLAACNPILLCIMNGGLVASGALATRLDFSMQLDYLHVTRYRGTTSGAGLQWKTRPSLSLRDRVVLVVDDILDEGATLEAIVNYCETEGAARVYTAVLVEKHHDRKQSSLQADFKGLDGEDCYLFGYGMDYKGYLRNAPGIFAIDDSDR